MELEGGKVLNDFRFRNHFSPTTFPTELMGVDEEELALQPTVHVCTIQGKFNSDAFTSCYLITLGTNIVYRVQTSNDSKQEKKEIPP